MIISSDLFTEYLKKTICKGVKTQIHGMYSHIRDMWTSTCVCILCLKYALSCTIPVLEHLRFVLKLWEFLFQCAIALLLLITHID